MFGLRFDSSWRETPEQWRARRKRERAELEERLADAVEWTPAIKWAPELTIRGASYRPVSLFEVVPLLNHDLAAAGPSQLAVSPSGRWCYCEKLMPRGHVEETYQGNRKGNVVFDTDVLIPAVHENRGDGFTRIPWMSLTPMEILSLRPGTRLARGRVVVAGLGLGHQLCEVSNKRNVKSLVLVERDAGLVEWLFPRLQPHLGMPVDVIVGDAHKVLPQLTADVALVDIFPGYGGNCWERARLVSKCEGIRKIWAWGSA